MTKEELEKEAEEKYVEVDREFIACQDEGEVFNIGYILGAEPREKQIAELERALSAMEKGTCDICKVKDAEFYEKRIAELEAQNKILERRIIRAKECMKKLLFIINSEPSNYNCKGLMRDADDFIHNRTCNIRKSGNHCITEEPCIMCDR